MGYLRVPPDTVQYNREPRKVSLKNLKKWSKAGSGPKQELGRYFNGGRRWHTQFCTSRHRHTSIFLRRKLRRWLLNLEKYGMAKLVLVALGRPGSSAPEASALRENLGNMIKTDTPMLRRELQSEASSMVPTRGRSIITGDHCFLIGTAIALPGPVDEQLIRTCYQLVDCSALGRLDLFWRACSRNLACAARACFCGRWARHGVRDDSLVMNSTKHTSASSASRRALVTCCGAHTALSTAAPATMVLPAEIWD